MRTGTSRGKELYLKGDRHALQAILRDKGFHSTEGRLWLLSILKNSRHPMSVPEVARWLSATLDEVNVYRALEALAGVGILTRSDVRRGGAHYELAEGHHHHIVCKSCGRTEDVEDCADKKLEARVLKETKLFAKIDTHALEFFGTCYSCAHRSI